MKTLDDIFNEYAGILENAAKQYHNDCIAYGKDNVGLNIRHIARDLTDEVVSFVVNKFKEEVDGIEL